MCEHCEPKGKAHLLNNKNESGRTDMLELFIHRSGKLITNAEGNVNPIGHVFDINYCPMCGRKLEGAKG